MIVGGCRVRQKTAFLEHTHTMSADSPIVDEQERSASPPGAPLRHRRVASPSLGIPRRLFQSGFENFCVTEGMTNDGLLAEFFRVLNGTIQAAAYELAICGVKPVPSQYETGQWPVGRLIALANAMGGEDEGDAAAMRLQIHNAANKAMQVCEAALVHGDGPTDSAEEMALGFIEQDRLPNGKTVMDCWVAKQRQTDHLVTQTNPLRFAPPLPESDVPYGGIDGDIDQFLMMPIGGAAPVWIWMVGLTVICAYLWVVALLVTSQQQRC